MLLSQIRNQASYYVDPIQLSDLEILHKISSHVVTFQYNTFVVQDVKLTFDFPKSFPSLSLMGVPSRISLCVYIYIYAKLNTYCKIHSLPSNQGDINAVRNSNSKIWNESSHQ